VFGKLDSETLLCVRDPLHGGERNLELSIAESADPDGRNGAQPFGDPKIAFWHALTFLETALEPFFLAARDFETTDFARAIEVVL
jgi:hypothetical protein